MGETINLPTHHRPSRVIHLCLQVSILQLLFHLKVATGHQLRYKSLVKKHMLPLVGKELIFS